MMNRISTLAIVLSLSLGISACTPEIREYARQQKKEIMEYEYGKTFATLFGIDVMFPTNRQIEEQQDKIMCLHSDGYERTVQMNGVNDQITYRKCLFHPDANYPSQRMDGRPTVGASNY